MPICTPWITGDDVADCCSVEVSSGTLFDLVAEQASDLLFELSGRLFPGECGPRTVRPSCNSCWCGYQVLSRGHVVGPWDWGYPYASLCDYCLVACDPSLVELSGYPVREISEVKIDGDVLAADQYRLFKYRYAQRLDDGRWPIQQNLTLADTEDNTFSITYSYGADPPALGVSAAAQLACELYKECNGEACALPKGVTRVNRQGITIEKLAFTNWAFTPSRHARGGKAPGWNTGMPLVDAFLSAYNAAGLKRRPVFYAPGKRQYAQEWG
jgi:hypothetical protein